MGRRTYLRAVLLTCAACLASCGQESAPPQSLKEALHSGEFRRSNDDLLITETLEKQGQDADYVGAAALDTKRVAQAIQAGAPDLPGGVKTISILFLRPDLDRLGNPGAHSFMDASFDVSDLKGAHVDRIGAYGTLDLAKSVQVVLPWNGAVGEWCAQHDSASNFCGIARNSVAPEFQWPEHS